MILRPINLLEIDALQILQPLGESLRVSPSLFVQLIQNSYLSQTDGGADFEHPKVVAEAFLIVPASLSLVSLHPDPFCDRIVIGRYESALPGMQIFRCVSTETRQVGNVSNFSALKTCSDRLCSILDNRQLVPLRQLP